jgi:hypothetical protein
LIFVEGRTLDEVRRRAEAEVFSTRSRAAASEWGKLYKKNDSMVFQSENPEEFLVRAQCLGEHLECRAGKYRLWQLVQTAKIPYPEPLETISRDQIRKLEKTALGLKPFVPGMAQIYKDSNAKGVFFIVGTSILAGGIVTTELFRADNASKVNTTFKMSQRKAYIDNANTLQNWRNVSIAATGAFYLWNVIDGFVSKRRNDGNKFTQMFDSDFKITPYADLYGTGGLILSFGF